MRRSADCGKTWLKYSDESVESAIGPVSSDQRVGLAKLVRQGRQLVALIPQWPDLVVYVSHDDGETWSEESRITT